MRWLLLAAVLVSCAPVQAAQPAPTEDPRVEALQRRVAMLEAEAKTPTFWMWGSEMTLPAGAQTTGVIPDTFTIRIRFTATTPVRTRIMSLDQYVRYRTAGTVEGVLTYPAATSVDVTFHDAEGCAGYVFVLDAAQEATITPDVTITRAPAERPTGICR